MLCFLLCVLNQVADKKDVKRVYRYLFVACKNYEVATEPALSLRPYGLNIQFLQEFLKLLVERAAINTDPRWLSHCQKYCRVKYKEGSYLNNLADSADLTSECTIISSRRAINTTISMVSFQSMRKRTTKKKHLHNCLVKRLDKYVTTRWRLLERGCH